MMISPAKMLAMLCLLHAPWLLPAQAADAPVAAVVPGVPGAASAVTPRLLEAFHDRVKSINVGGLPSSSYHLAKAQAWVDAAADAYHLGDRGELMLQSLAQADRLMAQVAATDSPAMAMQMTKETPLLAGATRLREDLWQQAAAMKSMPGLRCAHAPLAHFEVMLVMAGYRHAHSGWRDANVYVQASERLARQAQAQIDGCPPEAQPPAAAAAASTPAAAAPERQEEVTLKRPLPTNLYFDLGSQRLTAATRRALDRVAQRLLAQPALSVALDGHADARGSDTANRRLSQRRVQAVQAHLRSSGVAAARIRTEACGEAEPRARFDAIAEAGVGAEAAIDADGHALNRRVRLVWLGDPEQAASTDLRCSPNAAAPR